MNFFKLNNLGQSLLEIILALAIFSFFVLSFVVLAAGAGSSLFQGAEQTEAAVLASSGLEAIRSVKDHAWNELIYNNLTVSTSSDRWYINSGGPDFFDRYTRIITMENVCRSTSTHQITVCPEGFVDIQTKKFISEVTWQTVNGINNTTTNEFFLTNWDSSDYQEDLSVEFDDGIFNSTTVTSTIGDLDGSVILDTYLGSVSCGWDSCPPSSTIIDISGSNQVTRVFAQTIGSSTYFYAVSGVANSKFYIYDATDKESPIFLGSYTASGVINGFFVSGTYAYLSTGNNSKELLILNIADPGSIVEVGSYNANSNANGNDVFVSGTRAYLVTNLGVGPPGVYPEFYILDVSNPASPTLLNSSSYFEAGESLNAVVVDGNYVYLASNDNAKELTILDISNPVAVVEIGSYNMGTNNNGLDLVKSGNYVYLINGVGSTMAILDVSNPASPSLVGSYVFSNTLNAVTVDESNYAFLASLEVGNQFQVIDISSSTSPTLVNYGDNGNFLGSDIFYLDGYIYFGGYNNSAELKIFWPGSITMPVGFVSPGEYFSSILDLGSGTRAIQILSWEEDKNFCTSCDIQLQIKTASLSGDLPSLPWVGPTGEGSYFTDYLGTLIPVSHNGDRYIQYRALLTSSSGTPILNSVTVNYK